MNISLPDAMKEFIEEQVESRGYGTSSEYLRELIRKEQDRVHLRALLLAGAESPIGQERTVFMSRLKRDLKKRRK